MSLSDPLGDMLTRIRNAQRARHSMCMSPASQLRANVLGVLKREGFIRGYSAEELRPGVARLKIELKYNEGEPVIKDITRVSRPGRRVYSKIKELPRVYAGLGISILSTPRGVMSDAEARAANVGGEVLCGVFGRRRSMSRVGKYPVELPAGVQVAIVSGILTAKGRLGELALRLTDLIEAKVEGNK